MNASNKKLLPLLSLLLTSTAMAEAPASPAPGTVTPLTQAERYARRCQKKAGQRDQKPQGPYLWGTRPSWDDSVPASDMRKSVLVSVDAPSLSKADVGVVLRGSSSEGSAVEVVVCDAEEDPEDAQMVWYRVEAWNPVAQEWENPCLPTGRVTPPRALAISGVWDASGTHRQEKGKLTLACENGAITKCIRWGYKPWASRNGQSLAPLHQACTRMARADYCGNGTSHTREATTIDMYDALGVQQLTTVAVTGWDPERASFEAAWAPDGAVCLARTRDGRALETIQQECPGRFVPGAAVEVGQGDRCTLQRKGVDPKAALLKNRG
jgi:hypothetical protein